MPVKDLREWLSRIDSPAELQRIKGADWNLEIGALTELMQQRAPVPALLFDEIPGYPKGYRVLTNVCSSIPRLAFSLEAPGAKKAMDLISHWRKSSKDIPLIPPVEVQNGSVMENVHLGKDVNLLEFPAPKWHEADGGRYIGTGCLVVMKDPDSGWINVGTYRVMTVDEQRATLYMSKGKHCHQIREKYWKKGQPCPVAVVMGQDPLLFINASMELPYGVCEYDYAGGLRKQPVEIIRGPITGLPVPAHAEIVIEGTITEGDIAPEGPFGEWTGYYASGVKDEAVIRVQSVLHRNDPILMGACPCKPPSEQTFYRGPIRSAIIWDQLEAAGIPGIAGVWVHEAGAGRMLLIVSINQKYAGHSRQAGLVASQCHGGAYASKCVIVVDDDVDITNTNEVLWAALTRCDPAEDVEILKKCWSTILDPTAYYKDGGLYNSRMVIDACRPYGKLGSFPAVLGPEKELVDRLKDKFAGLF
ncbi:MAG TPA: UbiD family decarboxylase [Clostridia bacterium]|nr:UbiD family decarboxylase [Clostridia bacterium]